jgi:opacity protein-like surface antigen
MKSIFAAAVAAPFLATAAVAGPYVDGGLEINTSGGDTVDQSYVVVGGYEAPLSENVSAYVEGGGGAGAIGDGDTEGVIRLAGGLSADVSENVSATARIEFNQFQDSDIDTIRYTANVRYTF